MNTVLKILVALILLPMAACGAFTCASCAMLPVAGMAGGSRKVKP